MFPGNEAIHMYIHVANKKIHRKGFGIYVRIPATIRFAESNQIDTVSGVGCLLFRRLFMAGLGFAAESSPPCVLPSRYHTSSTHLLSPSRD